MGLIELTKRCATDWDVTSPMTALDKSKDSVLTMALSGHGSTLDAIPPPRFRTAERFCKIALSARVPEKSTKVTPSRWCSLLLQSLVFVRWGAILLTPTPRLWESDAPSLLWGRDRGGKSAVAPI